MGLIQSARRVVLILCVMVAVSMASVQVAAAQPNEQNRTAPTAEQVGGNDYPWQTASMNGMSPLRFAYRNCTDYVAFQLNKQLGGSLQDIRFDWDDINQSGNGHASAWRAAAVGKYTVDDSPHQGAIAWWGSDTAGGYGHVALVAAVAPDGNSVTLHEYNTSWDGRFQSEPRTLQRGQSGWPQAFIHVADIYADGTFLTVSPTENYVVAGGAALPLRDWSAIGGPKPAVQVTRQQVAAMPTVPRENTRLTDFTSGTDYVVSQRKYQVVQKPESNQAAWGQELGAWAAGYVSPGMPGNVSTMGQQWNAASINLRGQSQTPVAVGPPPLKADLTGMGVSVRASSDQMALQ